MNGFLMIKHHKNTFGKCFNDNNHKRSRGEENNTDFQGSDQMLRNTLCNDTVWGGSRRPDLSQATCQIISIPLPKGVQIMRNLFLINLQIHVHGVFSEIFWSAKPIRTGSSRFIDVSIADFTGIRVVGGA